MTYNHIQPLSNIWGQSKKPIRRGVSYKNMLLILTEFGGNISKLACCGRHDTQHIDIQHNDIQRNDNQHDDFQYNDI